jgi:N-acetyltransferase
MAGVDSPDKDKILAPTQRPISRAAIRSNSSCTWGRIGRWLPHRRLNELRRDTGDVSELRPPVPLDGRIVRVEPIAEQHRDGLREAAEREPQIHRFTNLYTLGFERWFDQALAATEEIPFVVTVSGRPVGSTRYLNIEPFHRRTEIGWTWLERPQWGTGANIETKYLLLCNAFDRCGLMRVEFKTDARNLRVRGALLGIGARFVGIFRKHMVLPDSIRDSAWYAIVDDDWPRVKELLERKIDEHAR